MTVHIYLAPAASGKTTYILERARDASKDLLSESLILVPSAAHRYDLQRRLAGMGGAIGVRIDTFWRFSQDVLAMTGEKYATISDTKRLRLMQHVVNHFPLEHYHPLAHKPGFIWKLAEFIHTLKDAKIFPDEYLVAVDQFHPVRRLRELGLIYQEYQSYLHDLKWVDRSGWAWLAVEALEKDVQKVAEKWPLIIVDGFDNFSEVLLVMLELLSRNVEEMVITLAKESVNPGSQGSRQAFKLFQTTTRTLEERLGVPSEPLPVGLPLVGTRRSAALDHLEKNLFLDGAPTINGGDAITLIACPDRADEVRAALRWLKQRVVDDNIPLQDTALLARSITVYEPFIRQNASEFMLPIHLSSQMPLGTNPAVAAIVKLLELQLPVSDDDPSPALPRQGVVDAWRSPYFDWAKLPAFLGQRDNLALTSVDAEALDLLARNGRVIGGLQQWEELLHLRRMRDLDEQGMLDTGAPLDSEQRLALKFLRFQSALQPPDGLLSCSDYAEWLEVLLGAEPKEPGDDGLAGDSFLKLADLSESAGQGIHQRDLKALRELKEILRTMVSVEYEVGVSSPMSYAQFLNDLTGMIDASTYSLPEWRRGEKIFVSDVVQARGLSFRAVAILGLAEGEFPQTYVEDPFLWEADRIRLNQHEKVSLESSIESFEREYFYHAVTLPREKLLLTRPRIADGGAEWPPSPYWEEMQRIFKNDPVHLTTDAVPSPDQAASLSELVGSLVDYPRCRPALEHLDKVDEEEKADPGRHSRLRSAVEVFDLRFSRARTEQNADLPHRAGTFKKLFDPDYGWSPSRLETYHTCPYMFFVGKVLKLEPRPEPAVGMDVAQQGTIYHEILEALYKTAGIEERVDPDKLLALLPSIARRILDAAPEQQGFRETAWWRETRTEIVKNIARSIQVMAEIQEDFIPSEFELRFRGPHTLVVFEGEDSFRLRGVIDRVDKDREGRVRIIDYKTAGPYKYTKYTLESGEKIQLALYALAARDSFGYSEIADGFYWHVFHAEPSSLKLGEYGPEEAIGVAVSHAWRSVRGARQGHFVPSAPVDGCPSYCSAAGFCWSYRPGMWG